MKVGAVIVTYNRLNLLKGTIEKLMNQTIKLNEIIVIDNKSTDGTTDYLKTIADKITPVFLDENIGGAGGFNKGIREAYERGNDYIWIMDDDTFATENALENMLNKIKYIDEEKLGFLCSNVLFTDEKACVMNVPTTVPVWNDKVLDGIIRVKNASFVSVLFPRKVVKDIGLPIKDFFIWADDLEYTLRITKKYEAYMSIDSIVHHQMNSNIGIDLISENGERISRYFYEYRNKFYIHKKNGVRGSIYYTKNTIKNMLKVISKSKCKKGTKIKVILKGYIKGMTFNPKVEHVK